jgi:hypothetical protein
LLDLSFSAYVRSDQPPATLASTELPSIAFEWLRGQSNVVLRVSGGRRFPTEQFEPAIAFPPVTNPFTAVTGITVAKETDTGTPALAYQADIMMLEGFVGVRVYFESIPPVGVDALDRLLATASLIAALGVRRRAEASRA